MEAGGLSIARYQNLENVDQVVGSLQRTGAVIIENLLPEKLVDTLNADLRSEFDREGHLYQNEFNGHNTLRVGGVTKYSDSFASFLMHPAAITLADKVLKPHCEVYQVGSTTAIEILPGEDAQALHRDDTIYPMDLLDFEAQISVLWALDDFTEENGATHVLLKEKGISCPEIATLDDTHQAVMPKGSAVVYLGSTIHGGGANHTDAPRKALVNTYCLGWLRQEENQYLTLTREDVGAQPESVRRMLGFQAHGPYLGVWPEDPDGLWYEA